MTRERQCAIAVLALLAQLPLARAQTPEEFYHGKTISFLVGAGVGGGYDAYARPLARYMGKYIPGNPKIVVQNLEGGGGLRAANHLFNNAARDGSVIGMVQSGTPFAPLLGMDAAKFDATKFIWIGSMNKEGAVCVVWGASRVKKFDDVFVHELLVGGTGAGSQMETFPLMLRNLFGAKMKLVSGYKGGAEIFLAMERGEVEGRCAATLPAIKGLRPNWLAEGRAHVLVQTSLEADPELPGVPNALDFAKNDEQRQVMDMLFAAQGLDRPVFTPPGVPADRLQALREAFARALRDAEFLAEANASQLVLQYVSGDVVAAIVERVHAMPASVREAARRAIQP